MLALSAMLAAHADPLTPMIPCAVSYVLYLSNGFPHFLQICWFCENGSCVYFDAYL